MKPKDIKVGMTYTNAGAGRTTRTVIAIGDAFRPEQWFGDQDKIPDGPGVLFVQNGSAKDRRKLFLSSFAAWAGKESRSIVKKKNA